MDIVLTNEEYENIKKKKKCIGSGVDGSVFDMGNHVLYKFYHHLGDYINITGDGVYDSDGVNVRSIRELRRIGIRDNHKPINYVDKEGVLLFREEAIRKAIEKQKYVKYTTLPQNIIKVNDRVVGCVYKKFDSKIGIYASSFLPLKYRKLILKRLVIKVNELHKNYIYPVTLAQKNTLFPFSSKDSNVLLCNGFDPVLIDVDGISAYYSDSFDERRYDNSMGSLSKLIIEILTGVDLYEYETTEDIEMLIDSCIEQGISEYIMRSYVNNGRLEKKEIKELLLK